MSDPTPFRPNWASHPGNTIRDLIEEKGWSWEEAEEHTGLFQGYLKQLCAGKNRITEAAAERLGESGHGSEQFWLNRQAQYDETLARLSGLVKPEPEEDETQRAEEYATLAAKYGRSVIVPPQLHRSQQ